MAAELWARTSPKKSAARPSCAMTLQTQLAQVQQRRQQHRTLVVRRKKRLAAEPHSAPATHRTLTSAVPTDPLLVVEVCSTSPIRVHTHCELTSKLVAELPPGTQLQALESRNTPGGIRRIHVAHMGSSTPIGWVTARRSRLSQELVRGVRTPPSSHAVGSGARSHSTSSRAGVPSAQPKRRGR